MMTELKKIERNNVAQARRRSLGGEAADRIRQAIFRGTYPPGAQLREVELSERLGVSRGPIREALLRLESEGLVRSQWHRGAIVTEFTDQDIAEIDSLRSALEQLAVHEVIAKSSEADLEAIEAAVSRMERAETDLQVLRYDMEFHDAVYAAAGHQRLEDAWWSIRSQVYLFLLSRLRVSADNYLADVPVEHRQLVEILRTGDEEAALARFAVHRLHARDVLANTTRDDGS